MKVLLVQPSAGFLLRGTSHPLCRSIMVSASYLKEKNVEVKVCNRCIEKKKLKSITKDFTPDFVCIFASHTSSIKDAVFVSEYFKEKNIKTIWCDALAALSPDGIFDLGCCDYILIDECCVSFFNLINALKNNLPIENVNGIAYRNNNKTVKTKPQELVELSELPIIDWSLIDAKKCFRSFPGCKNMLYLFSSVGCPFKCTFCYATVLYKHLRRKRPIDYVLSEIEYLCKEKGLDGVNFSDELMLFDDDELEKIKALREKLDNRFIFGGETRPQLYDRDKLQKLYDAGCRWLLFGLETGSQKMRSEFNKDYDDEKIRSVIDLCNEIGISSFGSFIIGYPGETEDDLKKTVSFALSLNLDAFLVNYFIPVVGSESYKKLNESNAFSIKSMLEYEKLISPDNYPNNFSKVPKYELAVIKSYFDLITITRTKNSDSQAIGIEFLKKAINTVLGYLKGNPSEFTKTIISTIKRAFGVMFFPVFFRKTAKKYGLYNINFK